MKNIESIYSVVSRLVVIFTAFLAGCFVQKIAPGIIEAVNPWPHVLLLLMTLFCLVAPLVVSFSTPKQPWIFIIPALLATMQIKEPVSTSGQVVSVLLVLASVGWPILYIAYRNHVDTKIASEVNK